MAYDREEDIKKVMASNPGMTRAEAEQQIDRNLAINQNFSANLPKGNFNGALGSIFKTAKITTLKTAGDNARIEREAVEGSTIGLSIGQSAGGFQSLTVTTDEGETVTVEPTVAMMTNSIDGGGIKVTKTSGNKSEITTLTGKATSDGFLATVITQGSPKGIEKAIRASVTSDDNLIKVKVKETSSNPEVAEKNVNVDVSTKVVKDVKEVTKEQNRLLGNPFASLSEIVSNGVPKESITGAAGNPFSNILGNVAGVLIGALKQSSFPNINTTSIAKISKNVTNPNTGKVIEVTTITAKGDTNLKKSVDNTNLISPKVVTPTTPIFSLGSLQSGWQGTYTPESSLSSIFTFVNTEEELETELRGSYKDRLYTALLIGSTLTSRNRDHSVEKLHKNAIKRQQREWSEYYQRNFGGPLGHYYIRKDGSIQRGRPGRIASHPNPESWGGFAHRTLVVQLVGGLTIDAPYKDEYKKWSARSVFVSADAYTPQQWASFEKIVLAFRKVTSGGEVLSLDELYDDPNCGFSGRDWTKQRFGWETLYTGDNALETRYKGGLGPLYPDEISKYLPENIAKPTVSPVNTKATPAPKAAEVSEPTTGKPPVKTQEEQLSDEDKLRLIETDIDELNRKLKNFKGERSVLLGDRNGNGAKITITEDNINRITVEIESLEDEAQELRTRIYPAIEKRKIVNKIQVLLDQKTETLSITESKFNSGFTNVQSSATRNKLLSETPETITNLKIDIGELKTQLKDATKELEIALRQQEISSGR